MKYIDRSKSLITGKDNLEHLYTFRDYPVFFGCVDSNKENDLLADMSWKICPESGVIQIDKLIPLDILYQSQHVDGTGSTWTKYYKDFAKYIGNNTTGNLLEIGGGMGKLAEEVLDKNNIESYTIIEPNPIIKSNDKLNIIKGFFDGNTKIDTNINTVIFSQVLEHIYDPNEFINNIYSFLKTGEKLIFAYPDLKKWLELNYTNAINFEHCMFLTDYFIDIILQKFGFEIVDKTFYNGHSVFYTCVKNKKQKYVNYENKYNEYKEIFLSYVKYYNDLVKSLNTKLNDFNGEVYLFGGHVFSQHLISCGLNQEKIKSILDNSDLKKGKRLYGTKFNVQGPEIITGKNNIAVILKAAQYQEEIKKQLLEINPNVEIWE